ncbi:hypothetical protein [Mycolicibacterium litorale]|uniref:Intracellular septation protein A n=1 Tax=Mycolicibacterium litorale TaxID=758802 RepID=A0AAD1IIV4_9MYCO|nr:hypothetical protein [Mycolicibacterium litorale]MCV7414900.1 hypothetical protein [Mycolicibacterium litorale]TDY08146.1 intracellular septation protein A [Mycolicibacterium litorale]BBY16069.1 hypothetical protein MLIT_16610 [Mycolicibacterium litorale]
MGIVLGFAPWVVYWILLGNVPFLAAAVVALAVAVAALALGPARHAPGRSLDVGATATFAVLTLLTLVVSESFAERWLAPLSFAGIFLTALVGVLTKRPFVREFAAAGQPKDIVGTDLFEQITVRLTWIWVGIFAAMAVSSAVPPLIRSDASILDTDTPVTFVCYWLIPFALLAAGALASRVLPDRMTAGAGDITRKTTFLAYSEAAIDELYYLAQEHVNREVGPGQEAYNVQVGGKGTPLVGDESRQSWPATYKVRERRR